MPSVPVSRDYIPAYAGYFLNDGPDHLRTAWQCTNLIENAVLYPETRHIALQLYNVMGTLTGLCRLNRQRAEAALASIGVLAGEP